jgi:hypothetical protein
MPPFHASSPTPTIPGSMWLPSYTLASIWPLDRAFRLLLWLSFMSLAPSLVPCSWTIPRIFETTASLIKKLSNKSFYANSFMHLHTDELATRVWRSAAPLKCKVSCWLARRWHLPTNERWFQNRLSTSATCLSCLEDEYIDHILLLCPRAKEVWNFFHRDFDTRSLICFADIWLTHDHTPSLGPSGKGGMLSPLMELRKTFP